MKKSFYNLKAFSIFIILNLGFFSYAEHISFSADSMSGTIGDKSDFTTLNGDASVITESMEIYADSISMSGENFRLIEANGNIRGVNIKSQLEFKCNKLRYDRETKIALLEDDVTLVDKKNDVQAKAHNIEYNQETDVAIMEIDIELKQKENICSGVYAVYRKKEQLLDLTGNAQIKQGNDTFRAQEITLNLDSQEITLDGRVKGSIVDERASENKEEVEKSPDEIENSEEKNDLETKDKAKKDA